MGCCEVSKPREESHTSAKADPKPRRRDRRGRFLPRTRDERFAWIEAELGVAERGSVAVVRPRPSPDPNGYGRAGLVVTAFFAVLVGESLGWWDAGLATPVAMAIAALACGLVTLLWKRRADCITASRYGVSLAGRPRGELWPWADLLDRRWRRDGYLLMFRQGDVALPDGEAGAAIARAAWAVLYRRDRLVPTADDVANLPPDTALSPAAETADVSDAASRALSPAETPSSSEPPLDA